jgi:type VI protein secretion system component Hcp
MGKVLMRCNGINDEGQDPTQKCGIDVLAYNTVIQPGQGPALTITKELDRSSALLAQACANGSSIDEIAIDVFEDDDAADLPLIAITFSDCGIESLDMSVAAHSGLPCETITILYSRVEWKYTGSDGRIENASFVASRAIQDDGAHLQKPRLNEYVPNTAFIMMWMSAAHPELDDVCHAMKEVFGSFGIKAVRTDDIQHDDKITDLILNKIATSEFLIADLTGERPNVYYEVGHAHAMGKRPFLYRKTGTELHFDLAVHNVRQYKNILELRDLLSRRLEVLVR